MYSAALTSALTEKVVVTRDSLSGKTVSRCEIHFECLKVEEKDLRFKIVCVCVSMCVCVCVPVSFNVMLLLVFVNE